MGEDIELDLFRVDFPSAVRIEEVPGQMANPSDGVVAQWFFGLDGESDSVRAIDGERALVLIVVIEPSLDFSRAQGRLENPETQSGDASGRHILAIRKGERFGEAARKLGAVLFAEAPVGVGPIRHIEIERGISAPQILFPIEGNFINVSVRHALSRCDSELAL